MVDGVTFENLLRRSTEPVDSRILAIVIPDHMTRQPLYWPRRPAVLSLFEDLSQLAGSRLKSGP
jgi:hypothetical protein